MGRKYRGGLIGALPVTLTGDEYWDNVSLLIRGDTATDLSGNHTPTNNGATVDTGTYKFSTGSLLFNSSQSDRIEVPNNSSLDLGTSNFTIEMWVNLNRNSGTAQYLFDLGTGGNGISLIYHNGFRAYTVFDGLSDSVYTTTTSFATDTWYHVALAREGSVKRLFVNGNQVSSSSTSINSTGQNAAIGSYGTYTSYYTDGNIEDVRVTKGVARYTGNFSSELPTDSFLDYGSSVVGMMTLHDRYVDRISANT